MLVNINDDMLTPKVFLYVIKQLHILPMDRCLIISEHLTYYVDCLMMNIGTSTNYCYHHLHIGSFSVDGGPTRRGTPIGTTLFEILLKWAAVTTHPNVIIKEEEFTPIVFPYCNTDSTASHWFPK